MDFVPATYSTGPLSSLGKLPEPESTHDSFSRIIMIKGAGGSMNACSHLDQIRNVRPHTSGCEECLKTGDVWVHLRLCLICGHVGCCDSSKNKHATKHFHATNHPIIRSFEPGEDWYWCYVDQVMFELAP